MNSKIIKLFRKAIPSKADVDFTKINEIAIPFGYIIHPDLCTQEIIDWLQSENVNFNSSFSINQVMCQRSFTILYF